MSASQKGGDQMEEKTYLDMTDDQALEKLLSLSLELLEVDKARGNTLYEIQGYLKERLLGNGGDKAKPETGRFALSEGQKALRTLTLMDRCKHKLIILQRTFELIGEDPQEEIEPITFGAGMATFCEEMVDQLMEAHEMVAAMKAYFKGLDEEGDRIAEQGQA